MLVGLVVALDVGDGTGVHEACECVDMGVGVISRQITVFQPQETLDTQVLAQPGFHLRQLHATVAVRVEQTGRSAQQGTQAVSFIDPPENEIDFSSGAPYPPVTQLPG